LTTLVDDEVLETLGVVGPRPAIADKLQWADVVADLKARNARGAWRATEPPRIGRLLPGVALGRGPAPPSPEGTAQRLRVSRIRRVV